VPDAGAERTECVARAHRLCAASRSVDAAHVAPRHEIGEHDGEDAEQPRQMQGFGAAADAVATDGFRDFQGVAVIAQDIAAGDGFGDAEECQQEGANEDRAIGRSFGHVGERKQQFDDAYHHLPFVLSPTVPHACLRYRGALCGRFLAGG